MRVPRRRGIVGAVAEPILPQWDIAANMQATHKQSIIRHFGLKVMPLLICTEFTPLMGEYVTQFQNVLNGCRFDV
jgi:hypothetical protein